MRSSKDLGKKTQRRHTVSEPAVWDQTEEILLAELLRNCLRRQTAGTQIRGHNSRSGSFFRHQPTSTPDYLLQTFQTHLNGPAQRNRQDARLESAWSKPPSSAGWREWLMNDVLGLRDLGGVRELFSLASVFAHSTAGDTQRKATDAHWIQVAEMVAERTQRATVDDLTARAQDITAALRVVRGRKPGDRSSSSKNKAR